MTDLIFETAGNISQTDTTADDTTITITPEAAPLRAIHRTIDGVIDHRGPMPLLRETCAVLDVLGAQGVSVLRTHIGTAHDAGERTFTCPDCHGALYLSGRGMRPSQRVGGTRAFFVHHPGAGASTCPAASRVGRHPHAVDAARFAGRQEGPRHWALKMALAGSLEADPEVTDVAVERVIVRDGARRWPDVQARIGGARIIFEVQTAAPQAPMVRARMQFYEEAGCRTLWVLDGDAAKEILPLQGFQDIIWRQGGIVAALDDDLVATAGQVGPARLRLITLRETATGLAFAQRTVSLTEAIAVLAPENAGNRPLIGIDPATRRIFAALRTGDFVALQVGIDALCRNLGTDLTAAQAVADGLPAAIGALGTFLTGRKCTASGFAETHAAAIINSFLNTARHRPWAPLLAEARGLTPEIDIRLAHPSTAAKLDAALAALAVDPAHADPIARWMPVLAHLFPRMTAAPRMAQTGTRSG